MLSQHGVFCPMLRKGRLGNASQSAGLIERNEMTLPYKISRFHRESILCAFAIFPSPSCFPQPNAGGEPPPPLTDCRRPKNVHGGGRLQCLVRRRALAAEVRLAGRGRETGPEVVAVGACGSLS